MQGNLYEQQRDVHVRGEHTLKDLEQVINAVYEEVVKWRKNIFLLRRGAAGKSYIRETTRLIDAWNKNSEVLKNVALKAVIIMPHLLLQKPSFKAKSKKHSISPSRRMSLWQAGEFDKLVREARYIQECYGSRRRSRNPEQVSKIFSKLMLEGKVNAAMRPLDETNSGDVLSLSNEVLEELLKKHPASQPAGESTLIRGEVPFVDPAVFANIDEASVARAAMYTKGAAGPSGLDALGWRHILVSKNYGYTGKELRESIVSMARNLATRTLEIQEDGSTSIEAYLSCRLIPLDKLPGVLPIGIGEVIRRIIGKTVVATLKSQIVQCAGPMQLCAGQRSGCEAAVHAMTQAFDQDESEAILLVDAANAFNSINRKVLLHNIQYLCPVLAIYTINCYQSPSRLFVQGGKEFRLLRVLLRVILLLCQYMQSVSHHYFVK